MVKALGVPGLWDEMRWAAPHVKRRRAACTFHVPADWRRTCCVHSLLFPLSTVTAAASRDVVLVEVQLQHGVPSPRTTMLPGIALHPAHLMEGSRRFAPSFLLTDRSGASLLFVTTLVCMPTQPKENTFFCVVFYVYKASRRCCVT
jgi:hypothetical protein